jgi:hypothetical protein
MYIPRQVHVKYVVEKSALGQGFLQVFQLSPVSIIPPMLYIHILFILHQCYIILLTVYP